MACRGALQLGVPKPDEGASAPSPEQPSRLEVVVEPGAGRGIFEGSLSPILGDRATFMGCLALAAQLFSPQRA